ncbi:MAG: hypothetical protein ACRDTJ_03225, partial [Pseudonocardiaceae bacterium]
AIYAREPYAGHFELLAPIEPVDPATAPPFDCAPSTTLTAPGPVPTARREISGLITPECQASGCC